MSNATIDSSEFDQLISELTTNGKRYNQVKTEFKKLLVNSENNLKNVLPEGASNNLKNSTYNELVAKDYNFGGAVGARSEYGVIAAETGRKPGKMPPSEQLERWVSQKLGVSGKEAKSVAFLVARKIKQKGTRRYQRKGPQLITTFENRINDSDLPVFIKKALDILTK